MKDNLNGQWKEAAAGSDGLNSLWYVPNAAAGHTTITVTGSSSGPLRGVAAEYSGVAISSPLDVAGCAAGTGTSAATPTLSGAASGELAFAGLGMFDNPATVSAGSGSTLRTQLTGSNGTEADEDVLSSANASMSQGFGLSVSSSGWIACEGLFKPASTWYGEFTSGCPDATVYPGNQNTLAWINGTLTCPSDPLGSGQTVGALAVQSSGGSGVVRADLFSPPGTVNGNSTSPPAFADGTTYYVSVPTLAPTGLPTITYGASSFFQVWQFDHPGPCCNPILSEFLTADNPVTGAQIDPQDNNHYVVQESIINPSNDQITGTAGYWIGPAVDHNWHTLTVKDSFSSTANGSVQLWWDGMSQTWTSPSVTTLSNIVTLPFGNSHPYSLDINQYRAAAISGTFTVWQGAPKIGTTLASVIPDVSPHGP